MKINVAELDFTLLIDADDIKARVDAIAGALNTEYAGKKPLFVGVLNGCFMFMADLVRQMSMPCEVAFTKVASYHGGMKTTWQLRNDLDLAVDVEGRDIILLEDISDTGNTLSFLIEDLKQRKPASIIVCALLVKPAAQQYHIAELKYVGFEIEDKFVVGYGLDYKEQGRNLNGIYQLV
ncbi:hypoxanthine phosphoribosyltransferase [Mucilaginibacter sp. HD30]